MLVIAVYQLAELYILCIRKGMRPSIAQALPPSPSPGACILCLQLVITLK